MQRMKDKMNAKLATTKRMSEPTPAAPESASIPSLSQQKSSLEQFNELPLKTVSEATQKKMQEDSVSAFLHKVDEKEREDQKKEEQAKQEEDQRQRSFEASLMFGRDDPTSVPDESAGQQLSQKKAPPKAPADDDMIPEDNPISAMMALKHPEAQKEIMDASTEEMAQSHYSSLSGRANPY